MSKHNLLSSNWKFTLEDQLHGKLICSYQLNEKFVDALNVFFSSAIAEQRGDRTVVNLNDLFMCRDEALRVLREKIERNIQDAMEGLIYEVRSEVLRRLNGWYFFINHNATKDLREIRKFYLNGVNDRMKAHQGARPRREVFLREITDAYGTAADKSNKKAKAAATAYAVKGFWEIQGKYGVRRVEYNFSDRKYEFYGKVTKAALAREMDLSGHQISQSVLSRQMKRYKIEMSDLETVYDNNRLKRERA
ncbi:MAG: hypothetical protein ACXW3C_08335 [Pyrinomonadaceae bacterium]